MQLRGQGLALGSRGSPASPWRILAYLALIGGAFLIFRGYQQGAIQPLLVATPTPTRTSSSYAQEAQAHFSAGRVEQAIRAYQEGVAVDPADARLGAELARVQTYSSALLTTSEERQARLAEARASVDAARDSRPDDAFVQAVRTLVYDWSASVEPLANERDRFLNEAEASAVRAQLLDPGSPVAQAFYAELLLDQGVFDRAYDLVSVAAANADPADPMSMDVHRVFGTVLEGTGNYRQAIEEYLAASEIAPNFTYLYLLIGANYRQLGANAPSEADRRVLMNSALEAFDRAARINDQLGIEDPTPYLSIGKTYLQDGEFFIAAINVERALAIDPSNPDIFGRLGIIFFKARNYESAVEVLRCAVEGCSPDESGRLLCELKVLLCDDDTDPAAVGSLVPGQALGDGTLEYYYTYASVLTSFRGSPLVPNACSRAEALFQQLLGQYGGDPIVTGIVAENRALCSEPPPTPEATPEGTPVL